jgi:hypothetical protein
MQKHHHADPAILEHRALTEARLSSLFERAKSTANVDDIKKFILTASNSHFTAYVAFVTTIFDNAPSAIDIDEVIPVAQDAWNYFPHRALDGRCPAELMR